MKYYKLFIDLQDQTAWRLGDITRQDLTPGDNWQFVQPPMVPMDSSLRENAEGPFRTLLKNNGKPMGYTIAGYANVPIGAFKMTTALKGVDGFTVFPVMIDGFAQRDLYHIFHFWDEIDCVDEECSEFTKFSENDPVRPDLAGQYSGFYKLRIDPKRAKGKHIFRLAKSRSDIIVSEEVKRRFEVAGLTGAVFESVTED